MNRETRQITTKFNAGILSIELHDMLQAIDLEQKRELVESMSCDDELIGHITSQIIEKWTESGYSGGSSCVAQPNPAQCQGLDWAWRSVAKMSGEVARKEIECLENALQCALDDNSRLKAELFSLTAFQRR